MTVDPRPALRARKGGGGFGDRPLRGKVGVDDDFARGSQPIFSA
jgi:hypothetical protein